MVAPHNPLILILKIAFTICFEDVRKKEHFLLFYELYRMQKSMLHLL